MVAAETNIPESLKPMEFDRRGRTKAMIVDVLLAEVQCCHVEAVVGSPADNPNNRPVLVRFD